MGGLSGISLRSQTLRHSHLAEHNVILVVRRLSQEDPGWNGTNRTDSGHCSKGRK